MSIWYKKINKRLELPICSVNFLDKARQGRGSKEPPRPVFLLPSPKHKSILGKSIPCFPEKWCAWTDSWPLPGWVHDCPSRQHLLRLILNLPFSCQCFVTAFSSLSPGRGGHFWPLTIISSMNDKRLLGSIMKGAMWKHGPTKLRVICNTASQLGWFCSWEHLGIPGDIIGCYICVRCYWYLVRSDQKCYWTWNTEGWTRNTKGWTNSHGPKMLI